jgi:DNA polymerase-3 subunit epsilon
MGKLIGFDTETTGIDPKTDKILSIAYTRGSDSEDIAIRYLNWDVDVPEEASAVNGLTREKLAEIGEEPAVVLREVAEYLTSSPANLMAYNVAFDIKMLYWDLLEVGESDLARALVQKTVVDPLVIDRALDQYRKGGRKLIDVAKAFGAKYDDIDLHEADSDVRLMMRVWRLMRVKYMDELPKTAETLMEFQERAYKSWARGMNEWKRKKGYDGAIPEEWLVSWARSL